jgi:anti-sigma factor RsiW
MTSAVECRDIRHALGVYVVGAIDPAERALVDSHLSTCPDCREELAGLAGLPALLRRVPVAEAQQLAQDQVVSLPAAETPPDELLDSLLDRTTKVRRTQRWRSLAAAAAVVVLAGGAGAAGWSVLHQSGPTSGSVAVAPAHWQTASGSNAATRTSATVRFMAQPWGVALDSQVVGVPPGTLCQLQVTDAAGHRTVVGSWTATYRADTVWYPGSSSVALASMRSFQITSGGKVLVSVPVHSVH